MSFFKNLPTDALEHIYSYDNTCRNNFDYIIRCLNFVSGEHEKKQDACMTLIRLNIKNGNLNNDKTIRQMVYRLNNRFKIGLTDTGGWTESHGAFITNYFEKPYKFMLKSNKERNVSFWD